MIDRGCTMAQVAAEFEDLARQNAKLPLEERDGRAALVAVRKAQTVLGDTCAAICRPGWTGRAATAASLCGISSTGTLGKSTGI